MTLVSKLTQLLVLAVAFLLLPVMLNGLSSDLYSDFSILSSTQAHAQGLPTYWPYQGFLFDANGQAVEGNVNLRVRIYDSLNSNTPLWEANANNVGVRGGSFSVDLGQLGGTELKQLIEQTQAQFIGITVNNGIEMSPRTRIGSLPYATLAGNALTLNGLGSDDFVSQDNLNTLSEQVNTIQETAQTAQESAQNIEDSVQAAQNTANGAQEAAQAAQNTANGAQEAAQAAQNTANGAQEAAQAAQNTANGAQEAAQAAQNTANQAQEAAQAALNEAAARLLIESYEYLNADQTTVLVNNLINGLGHLNATQVSQLITDALSNLDVVSSQSFQTHVETEAEARTALRTELSGQINALSQRIDQIQTTLEQLQQAINTANEATAAAQTTATEANELARANAIAHGTLSDTVSDIQTQLDTLDGVVNNLPNQGGSSAFILGVSNTASNGWFQYGNHQGVRAAGEMCKDSFPNDANAHFCSLGEVQEALSVGNFNNSINNVNTWIYTTVPRDNDSRKTYCQSFLYNSGHAASGTSLTIRTAAASVSGGNGIQMEYTNDLACTQQRKVLCCR